ncbi:MAG TPA: hypothetical protein VMS55_01450 [Myxococcota bacterium]|nr:hypothetical protein [Myxococcota bacterium]
MINEATSIPEKLWGCLSLALSNKDLAAACRTRLEGIREANLADGLVELFRGPWQLTEPQAREMRIWPVPQLALLRSAAVVAARVVEGGQGIQCRCTGRAGNPRALTVTLDEKFLSVEFVGPNLV